MAQPWMRTNHLSTSFGHACIYLLGGTTRDTEPIPIHLKSGDLLIMTGECRKAYHGKYYFISQTQSLFH